MTDKIAVVGAGIPEPFASAILAAQQDMPSLRKEDRNAFQKYNYVSIDGYYEKVPQVAAKHGLFWQTHELNYEIVGGNNVAYTYGHDLYYKDGCMVPNFSRTTVIHPIQGAQTAGSALSYAEKLFMRSLFKVVTGEEDADAVDQKQTGTVTKMPARAVAEPRPAPVEAKMGEIVGGIADGGIKVTEAEGGMPIVAAPSDPMMWQKAAQVFITFMPSCKTRADLRDFWETNTGTLDRMQKEAPPVYEEVKEAFAKHKVTLPAKAKKE